MKLALAAAVIALALAPLAIAQAPAEPYDLNDLSVLLPLPPTITEEAFLAPATKGAHGVMIPQEFFDRVPLLTASIPAEQIYPQIQALSFRIDPPANEIRVVWQPLVQSNSSRRAPIVYTIDAALHTFYKLPAADMGSLLSELAALKAASGVSTRGKALWIHPAIRAQGLRGAYARGLREIFLKRLGEKRLTRLTFMTIRGHMSFWDFGGFDVRGGRLVPMTIPRTGARLQTIHNPAFPRGDFHGSIKPEPKAASIDDDITAIARESRAIKDTGQAAQLLKAIRRIEDPRVHNPDTMDCVSCHIAQPARHWIARYFPTAEAPNSFQSRLNLDNASPLKAHTDHFRAFGYHLSEVSISTRVIQETALLVAEMNAKGLRPRARR